MPHLRRRSSLESSAALCKSPLRLLNSDSFSRIINLIPLEDAFVAVLACQHFRTGITKRFAASGGLQTPPAGVVSSLARFLWVRTIPEAAPHWLVRWDDRMCSRVCLGGGIEVLQYLQSHEGQWAAWMRDGKLTQAAARGGQLHVLQWLRAQGCPWSTDTFSSAARRGHLEILQWLRAAGCDWDQPSSLTAMAAAMGGQLGVLQWLREQGCEWNAATSIEAARGGHLELLQWLYAHSCPCNLDHCFHYAKQGSRYHFTAHQEVVATKQAHRPVLAWIQGLRQEQRDPGEQGPV